MSRGWSIWQIPQYHSEQLI